MPMHLVHRAQAERADPAGLPRSLEDIEAGPPCPGLRATLHVVVALVLVLIAWAALGKLDIVASAAGRLVPRSFVKIVQPAEAGLVQDILVTEGDRVHAGQVLLRMDSQIAAADRASVQADLDQRRLQLRRIDAELAGTPLTRQPGDPAELVLQVAAQYQAHRLQYRDAIAEADQTLARASHELDAARATLAKLQQSVPVLRQQAESYARLGSGGFFPALQVRDKEREANERARDLDAQEATVKSLEAAVAQARQRRSRIDSSYQSALRNERVDAANQAQKLEQERARQDHRSALLELRAPTAGIVKDLAVHTTGTVVAPGSVLLTVVPDNEPLVAEVQVRNDDVGFIAVGQPVRVKLVAYPFQKYGMLDGTVRQLAADAVDPQALVSRAVPATAPSYKALIALQAQSLVTPEANLRLLPGMQVIAEVRQGERTVLKYLLSPLRKVAQESGRER